MRALAILAVVLFHAFPAVFPGGYVGVDVFFVISGFLISQVVVDQIKLKTFSFRAFYNRRVLRIFPALCAVYFVFLVLGSILLLPAEFEQLGKHVFGGGIFISNYLLWKESGYFDKSSLLKPFLHLWSLSIEEQFYLFFPVLALVAFVKKIDWKKLLVVLLVLSFGLNVFLIKTHLASVFFFLPTRAWELLAGCLLSTVCIRPQESGIRQNILSILGVLLIVASIFFLNETILFPGWWAAFPVLGSASFIASGPFAFLNRKFFSSSVMLRIGLISYPLYLWHWPILSFSTIVTGEMLSVRHPFVASGCILLSFVLADLTFRFIESPLRLKKSIEIFQAKKSFGLVAVMLVLSLIGESVYLQKGFPARALNSQALRDSMPIFNESFDQKSRHCLKALESAEICDMNDATKPVDEVLLGDSHANHFFPGLSRSVAEEGKNLAVLGQSGTLPLWQVGSVSRQNETNDVFFNYILTNQRIKKVYLAGFWSQIADQPDLKFDGTPYHEDYIDLSTEPVKVSNSHLLELSLDRTLSVLTRAGKDVVIIQDVPRLPFQISSCLPRPFDFLPRAIHNCDLNFGNPQVDRSEVRQIIEQVASKYAEVQVLDPILAFCTATSCKIEDSGKMLYSDEHHLSILGSKWLFQQKRILNLLHKN